MQSIVTTLYHRPYVAAFLVAFLVIGILNRGVTRTLLLLVIGYTVAFLSEFCSIRWGFPYGMYHYIYENMPGELMLGGVPVWDSLSYVFMAYASWEMAHLGPHPQPLIRPLYPSGTSPPTSGGVPRRRVRAALLMMLLDIVTDPLAVRGDRWFLGKIFYYPHGGFYFGVPLSNFAGWFLVGLVIFSIYSILEKKFCPLPSAGEGGPAQRGRVRALGPLFYLSIMLFNLAITFWIGEWKLGITSTAVLCVLLRQSSKVWGSLRRASRCGPGVSTG